MFGHGEIATAFCCGRATGARFSGATLISGLNGTPTGFTTPAFTTNGWFLGGGAEVAVARGWFWRTEYRYARYRNEVLLEQGGSVFTADDRRRQFQLRQDIAALVVYVVDGDDDCRRKHRDEADGHDQVGQPVLDGGVPEYARQHG